MMKNILRSAAFAVSTVLTFAPAVSQAAVNQSQTPVHATYETSMQPALQLDVPWTGTLQLTINPDGIIQGYYHPSYEPAFIPVTGGRNGDNVWLDIGTSGRLHVNGKLRNGSIIGSAVDERTNTPYNFTARVQG